MARRQDDGAAGERERGRPRGPRPVDWDGPLPRIMFAFLVPLLASNAIQGASGTVTSILIGRYLGVEALASVAAFFPVFFFLISFIFGLGAGSTVLIGQAFGAGDMERVRKVAGTTLTFSFALGIVASALGTLFAPSILAFIGTPAEILDRASAFARVAFLAPVLFFIFFMYSNFLRGIGDSRTPLWFLAVNSALGIATTPPLMFGWFGLPALGLLGAAWSFPLSGGITLVLLLLYLRATGNPLKPDRDLVAKLRIDWGILRTMLGIGVPTALQLVMVSLAEIAVVTLVNGFGAEATAAYGAYYQVANYVQLPAISLGATVSIFGAQAIGAGRTDRLEGVIRAGLMLNAAVGGVLVALAYIFSSDVLRLFLTDETAFAIALRLLMITLWSYLVLGGSNIFAGIMRASGVVLWPTVLFIVSIWGVELPLAYFLSRHIGIDGVWIGYSSAYVANLAFQYGYYALFWRGREHRRLQAA